MSRIITRDSEGRENGWLIPLWNALERPDLRPEQVYLTVIKPGMRKGPHLHKKRRGHFVLVCGKAVLVSRGHGCKLFGIDPYTVHDLQKSYAVIKPGTPCAIYNTGSEDAYIINMPSPAWSKEDPDDWPVEGWKDPEWWIQSQTVEAYG